MLKTGHDLIDREIRAAYDRLPQMGSVDRDFVSRVLDLAGDVAGLRVLDVGCGRGELLAELTRRGPRAPLCGLDLSLARAGQTRGGRMTRVVVADIGRGLPFVASSFDRVFCLETLE